MRYLFPVDIFQLLLRPSRYLFECRVYHREISERVSCRYAYRYPLEDVVDQDLALLELFPDLSDAEIFQDYDVSGEHKYKEGSHCHDQAQYAADSLRTQSLCVIVDPYDRGDFSVFFTFYGSIYACDVTVAEGRIFWTDCLSAEKRHYDAVHFSRPGRFFFVRAFSVRCTDQAYGAALSQDKDID